MPAKMVASPLYLIEAEWQSGKLNQSVLAIVNDTLQRSLRSDAEVVQFDDQRWLAFARHSHLEKNLYEKRILAKLAELDATDHDKPYGIRFRLQDIASITHILDCVQQAAGNSNVEVDKAHGNVSLPHFQLAEQRRTARQQPTPEATSKLKSGTPAGNQSNTSGYRRIDARHATPHRSRLSFRAIQDLAKPDSQAIK
jgi:hypothetical protein